MKPARPRSIRDSTWLFAGRWALVYLALGGAWIVTSDHAVLHLGLPGTITQTLKGLAFVAATTLLLFAILLRSMRSLRQVEDQLESVIEACGIGVWIYDVAQDRVEVLPSEYRLLGQARLRPDTMAAFALVHRDDRDAVRESWRRAMADPACFQHSARYRLRHAEGHYIWVEGRGRIERSVDGRPLRMVGVDIDITAQKRNEEALAEARTRQEAVYRILGHAPVMILSGQARGNWKLDYVSPGSAGLGHELPQGGGPDLLLRDLLHPADRHLLDRLLDAGSDDDATPQARIESRLRHSNGSHAWFRLEIDLAPDGETGHGRRFEAVAIDIAAQKAMQRRHDLLQAAVNGLASGVTIADYTGEEDRLIQVSDGFLRMTGYAREEVLDRSCRFLQRDDRQQPGLALVRQALKERKSTKVQLRNYRKDGSMFWNELALAPIGTGDSRRTHFVGIQTDITSRVMMEEALRRASSTDPLTGLYNRTGFIAVMERMLAGSDHGVLVIICDVRRMQSLNDTRGADIGDAFLRLLADRAQALAGEAGAAGRVGGDEFAVAMPLPADADQAALVEEFHALLREPQVLPGIRLNQLFCLGWSVGAGGHHGGPLLAEAEMALNEAKRIGFSVARQYHPQIGEDIAARQQVIDALREALERREFELHYQPKVRLPDGAIEGAECLIRWRHSAFGLQSPASFIPIAEQSGLIVEIGAWVLETAAAFIADQRRQGIACPPLSINVSAVQFRGSDLHATFGAIVRKHGLQPSDFILEITESVLAEQEFVDTVLTRLREDGFRIAVDDFGTGFSSLQYLRSYPIDEIKIDQSYVRGVTGNAFNSSVIEMVCRLARHIDCKVTAEGVETPEESEAVGRLGCELGQGYLFSMPLVAEDFVWLLKDGGTLPRRRRLSVVPGPAVQEGQN